MLDEVQEMSLIGNLLRHFRDSWMVFKKTVATGSRSSFFRVRGDRRKDLGLYDAKVGCHLVKAPII